MKMAFRRFFLLIVCSLLLAKVSLAGVLTSDAAGEAVIQTPQEDSLMDHKAKVYNLQGEAEHAPKDSEDWQPLQKGAEILEGDRIKTKTGAAVEIYYDEFYQNFIRIDENTYAEFKSIEPTEVFLLDGEILNALDGLPNGSIYNVSTPTSIATVRGTRFLRGYKARDSSETTLVDEGSVDVVPVIDDKGTPDTANVFKVTADQTLALNAETVRSKNFAAVKPQPMSPEQKQHIERRIHEGRQNLAQFAGGEHVVNEAREKFQEMKKDTERMEKISGELKKRRDHISDGGGPPGPGGQGGPAGPGGGHESSGNPGSEPPGLKQASDGELSPVLPGEAESGRERLKKLDRGVAPAFEEKSKPYRDPEKVFSERQEGNVSPIPLPPRTAGPQGEGRPIPPAFPPVYEKPTQQEPHPKENFENPKPFAERSKQRHEVFNAFENPGKNHLGGEPKPPQNFQNHQGGHPPGPGGSQGPQGGNHAPPPQRPGDKR